MSFKILHVDHIGIAVKDLQASKAFYSGLLGIKHTDSDEVVEEQKVKVSFFPMGDAEFELLESTAPDGPIAKYIDRSGEGIQHVALAVDNLEAALEALKANGVRLIDEKPRYGAGGKDIAFIHPKSTGGILLELCCPRKK